MQSSPKQSRVRVNGVELAVHSWPGTGAPVLLVHATGFHGLCWSGVVAQLEGRPLYAVDLRGHGASQKQGPYTWSTFGRDVSELVERLELRGAIGVGHSLGGHVMTQVAAHCDRFRELVLVDPVILPPDVYADESPGSDHDRLYPIARRRNEFVSPEAMFERFRDREPYRHFRPDVLMAYCRGGLMPAPEGDGFVLACPPDVELAIYAGSSECDIHALLAEIEIPVVVLRGREAPGDRERFDFSSSPTWPGLADAFPEARDVYFPELSHFLPMEAPERVARFLAEACERHRPD